jgi:hypothetical protein
MLEEFIIVALEAFTNANGDADKFELQLRRKLMTYNTNVITPQVANSQPVGVSQIDNALSSLDVNDPIFGELENVDINNMNDDEILALAQRMGLMTKPEENE